MAAFSHHMSQPLPSVSPRTPQVTTQRKATLDTARSRLMRSYVGDSMRRSKKRRKKNMQKFVLSHPSEEIKIEMLLSQGQEPSQEDESRITGFLPEISIHKTPRSQPAQKNSLEDGANLETGRPKAVESLPSLQSNRNLTITDASVGADSDRDDAEGPLSRRSLSASGSRFDSQMGSRVSGGSEVDTMMAGRMARWKRRKELGAKFRRLAHFLTILFGLWKSHAKRVKHFMDTNVDLLDVQQPPDLLFDVTEYRADKQARVPQKTKRILETPPKQRTKAECRHVQISLGNYPSIAEYPLRMTRLMAERAWYERYDAKRVIMRQGHPARCYYFILNGSVLVTRMEKADGLSRTVCFLNRGEAFRDLGLVSNAPRQATVISKEPVELLVFGDNDYVDIFMSGGLREPHDPFLSSLFYLKGWPTELLADNPNQALLSYFKRGMILVNDSHFSDWLYIIKSGSCDILKKLKKVKPSTNQIQLPDPEEKVIIKLPRLPAVDHESIIDKNLRIAELRSQQQSYHVRTSTCFELGIAIRPIPKPAKRSLNPIIEVTKANEGVSSSMHRESLGSQTGSKDSLQLRGPFITKSVPSKHGLSPPSPVSPGMPSPDQDPVGSLKTLSALRTCSKRKRSKGQSGKKTISDQLNVKYWNSDLRPTEADLNPAFVRIQTLTKGNIFGLSQLIHEDQPTFSLVSNGAECILINKRFYMDNVTKDLMNTLRMEVSPYPSEAELQSFLQVYVDWENSRSSVIVEALFKNKLKKVNVFDARSCIEQQTSN